MTRRVHLRCRQRQRGISLIIILMLMLAAALLGGSATVIALQAERSTGADSDRQLAFQAAEAALVDAQEDIDTAPQPQMQHTRDFKFGPQNALMFPVTGCSQASNQGGSLGLCADEPAGIKPSWLAVDFDATGSAATSVPFGHFTGRAFPVAIPGLSLKPPRYVIELMPFVQSGAAATDNVHSYRITAIGYGATRDTQVILQAFYMKQD